MPEFILDMQTPEAARQFSELDAFTRGYIEAAFFTECEIGTLQNPGRGDKMRKWNPETDSNLPGDAGFADLAPETLARMIDDCNKFIVLFDKIEDKRDNILTEIRKLTKGDVQPEDKWPDDAHAGHDFWLTRNGHGAGFWDGDWPKPYDDQLTTAAKAFGEVSLCLGDDGKIYQM